MKYLTILTSLLGFWGVSSFVPMTNSQASLALSAGFLDAVGNFFQELDNFMDDASARRLGNGAAFYGKRKSNFYGDKDAMKKSDPQKFDALEDYRAPSTGGYFQWMPDEDGQMRPVTRMKNQVVERKIKDE